MEKEETQIIIIAGEASGDRHAAHLVDELKVRRPDIKFSGLGGEKMRSSGVAIYHDLTRLAVIGFWEVAKHYTALKRIFDDILKKIDEIKPACVILVDYPGFNLRLAKKLKKHGVRVFYYISPQVWAWKENRVHQVKKYVERMFVIFKFEKDFYARHGIDVSFVGHPLLDTLKVDCPKDEFLKKHGLKDFQLTIGLLPGSREKEITRILPVMLKAAAILKEKYPMLQFLIVKAPTIEHDMLTTHVNVEKLGIRLIDGDTTNAIHACDLCIVASGTATLETALLQKPMVIVYKTSWITWAIAKLFVKIPDIGLVNVVAGKRIVPECVQHKANAKAIAVELESIFKDETKIAAIKSELAQLKRNLDLGGASGRAADEILIRLGLI